MTQENELQQLPDQFSTTTIVGMGLIGGSLALGLRGAGYEGKIVGVSRQKSLDEARALGAIDHGVPYEDLASAAANADLVILATPIATIAEHLRILGAAGSKLPEQLVVTDVGSTKRSIVATAGKHLPETVAFIGGHPMAGSELRGMAAADPFLFQNAYYVLTPEGGVRTESTQRLGDFLGCLGARVLVMEPAAHDRVAATISHLPQALAASLVHFLDSLGALRNDGIHLAAGGFRDMTRIASSPYSVWQDIFETNRDVVREVLDEFLKFTREQVGELADQDLEKLFDHAASTRAEIPRDTKGFLSRLWNVLVVVEDRPGIVAGIAGPLAERGINIKDIEVLKVREGDGGSLRLAFASEELAREAVAILTREGHQARLRD